MAVTKFAFPTTIHFGAGARKLVAGHLKEQGLKRPLIVTDTGLAALPILHAVQEAIGYVPEDAIPAIAEALNITRAEMHGVVTFYHDFRREPAGRLQVAGALAGRRSGAGRLFPAPACDAQAE